MPYSIRSESQEQSAFLKWFRLEYPGVVILSIPNGALTGARGKSKLKTQGLVSGTPDLFVPEWHLWIEMKRSDGGLISPDQKNMLEYLSRIGYNCFVGYGCEKTIEFTVEFCKAKKNKGII